METFSCVLRAGLRGPDRFVALTAADSRSRIPKLILWSFIALCLLSSMIVALGNNVSAQTAIGSGLNATEGVAISPNSSSPLTDSMWADSTAGRWLLNNHGNGAMPVSFWPCGSSYGCIPYSGTLTGGINTEAGLLYPTGGANFFLQSGTQSAQNGPVWSGYTLPSSVTAGGVLYGSSTTAVAQNTAHTLDSSGDLTANGSLSTGQNSGLQGKLTFFGATSGSQNISINGTSTSLTSTATFAAPKFTVNSNGGHIQTNLANSDVAGTISLTSAGSAFQSFTTAYSSVPICVITPTTTPGTKSFWVTTTTGAVTANISTPSTIIFNYICIGNPN
jgi:hypothetical protein